MGGIVWLLLGTLAFCISTQGQKSIHENPRMALDFSLDLEETGENLSKGMGTSLTKQDFINGEKLKNNSSMEDAKKAMHLVLKNKKEFGKKQTSPVKDRSVQREVKYRWPNGEVPYKVETVFTEDDKAAIASAIQNIQDNSCVTFRPAVTGDLDYVYIFTTNASGCTGHRFLGPGYGEHHLNLEGDSGDGLTCITTGVIIHELMHMLGFAHEHQRPDRDSMVSVNWANVEVEKAHNLFRDSWETEDLTAVPICNSTGAVQATADFSGCVSGDVVTAYGVGYDFYSVMHYEFDSFAVDPSLATMVVVGPTGVVTSPGNVELSSMDITKLQKAYGCTGCGGYKRSSAGGTLSGSGTSDLLSPCEWVLETDSGQGISIDITMLTGSDCSTDYVEVRMGSSAAGQLVGRYCEGSMPAGVVSVGSSTVWIKWGKSNVASVMIAMWSVYEVVCCQTLVLEDLDNLPTVKFNLTDQQVAGRTVYKLIEGLADVYYLYWYSANGWFIGTDPTSTSIIARNKGQNSCPGDTTVPWEYVTSEGFIPDEDAKLRCSDCTLFPSYPECEECCDTVTLSSTFNEFLNTSQYYSQFYGQFSYNGVDHNSHKVYQSDSFKTACLFYSDSGSWFINQCSDLNTKFRWISAPGTKCASQATGWIVYSQISKEDVNDESLSFTCPEATSKPTTTTTTTTTTKTNKPTNKPTTSEPTTKSTTTKPTTTKPTTTKPTTTKPTTTKPTTANPTTTKPTTTKPTITKPTTTKPTATKPTTTKPTTTKPTTTKPTTTKPTTTKTPSNTTILPLPAIGCLPCKDIEAGPMMGSYMLEDQTTADPRCVDGCVYSKGEDLYCFAQGDDFVKECS